MDMSRVHELTGKVFGQWTVLKFSHANGKMAYWLCRCDCGTERSVFGGDLKRGMSSGCGCQRLAKLSAAHTTHGMSSHDAYCSWQHMRTRCQNPKSNNYSLYGGRGIKVCDKWQAFDGFWEDMGPSWRVGLSIDRYPNKDGNYEASNCRWASDLEQARNRRTERVIDTPSGPMSITEAAEKYGLSRQTISSRLRYEWSNPADLVAPSLRPNRIYATGPRKPQP